jgi:hypothetical protein
MHDNTATHNGAAANEPAATTLATQVATANNGAGHRGGALPTDSGSDPFANLPSLRLSQEFSAGLGLTVKPGRVPARKPSKEVFVRVNPDPQYQFPTYVVELKEDGETYLVDRSLWPALADESTFGPRILLTAMSRPGNIVFLWPIRMPASDGKLDEWSRSALEIATTVATQSWTRVVSNRALGGYEAHVAPASATWGDPKWPTEPMSELMRRAFKDHFITNLDHPVLKRLRGEA